VTARDAEISQLKSQLAAKRETRATSSSRLSSALDSVPTTTITVTTGEVRRGCASPFNLSSGKYHWLPGI